MSDASPPGVSESDWKSTVVHVGDWVWGTVEGSFNEKQSISQMIVDAAIGMIPIVGDLTALRDLIAVVMGMVDDPRKREDKLQWMLLVVLIFALIPLAGGVIKGAGRILIHVMGEVGQIAEKGARSAQLLEKAREIIAMANRLGVGNAEKWLKELRFAAHQDEIVAKLNEFLMRLDGVFGAVQRKISWALPDSVLQRLASLRDNLARVEALVSAHVPDAIKQLDQDLRELQQLIYNGGETTSRVTAHTAEAGARNLSYTEELILLEGKGATRSVRGGFVQNGATPAAAAQWYKHEPGFPDLTKWSKPGARRQVTYPNIATFSGQIVNRELEPGEKVFRVFGPGKPTHGVPTPTSNAAGNFQTAFWGLGEAPVNAKRWREGSAVLDEWNHDGFIVVGEVLPGNRLPACTGVIAEQNGEKIGVQYLQGGEKQAMLEFSEQVAKELNDTGARVVATGRPQNFVANGVSWEVRPTAWTDANGIHGYLHMPGPGTVQTVRLGAREIASKRDEQRSN